MLHGQRASAQALLLVGCLCLCVGPACAHVKVNVTIRDAPGELDEDILKRGGYGYEVVEVSESYEMDDVVVDISIIEGGPPSSTPAPSAPPSGPGVNATVAHWETEVNLPLIIGCTVGGGIGVLIVVAVCVGLHQQPEPPSPRPPLPMGVAWPTIIHPSHHALEVHFHHSDGYEIKRSY